MSPKPIFIGTRKGLFTLGKASGSWSVERVSFLGDPISMVLPCRDGTTVFAAVKHGHFGLKLHRSRDGGATFEELSAPAYPKKPEGEIDLDPFRQTERSWSLGMIWAMEQGLPSQQGRIWCGTIPGGLFRSDDDGDTWQFMRSLWDQPVRKTNWFGGGFDDPGIHSILVDPHDSAHVLVAVSCGGVWRTRDDGATWEQTAHGMRSDYTGDDADALDPESQDPHRIDHCAAEPNVVWCQHHNGIFRSTDHAKTWTEVTDVKPSVFGFAVVAHPTDPDTAWFVPAQKDEFRIPVDGKMVVNRTRDGGRSFETLRNGLPQDHAYDLVFRHAVDVCGRGERLILGSTTGNLWLSEDGGDRFEAISGTLPPIACVRS